ncbi:MAG: hypothetical protein DCC67_20310 [Planctomycetota bacterium]|nr:MAG: hypothetical protein DCC67_20310 [Planctomycetota bacterium]
MNVTFTGLTITGGDGFFGGGGISFGSSSQPVTSGSLTVNKCAIIGNNALDAGGVFVGAARTGVNVSIVDSTISGNSSAFGGGVAALLIYDGSSSTPSTLSIGRSAVSGNTSSGKGGGLHARLTEAEFAIDDCSVSGNTADKGGGIYVYLDRADATIAGSSISDNTASEESGAGGGVFGMLGFSPSNGSRLSIEGCAITGNDSQGTGGGGGVAIDMSAGANEFSISNSRVADDNKALYGMGGGLFVKSSQGGEIRVENCIVSGNSALDEGDVKKAGVGGGVAIDARGAAVTLLQTTISGNVSKGGLHGGGGLYALLDEGTSPSRMTIDRSTISDNTADAGGGGLFGYISGSTNELLLANTTVSGNHSLHGMGGGAYVCFKVGGRFDGSNSTISGNDALDQFLGIGGGMAISRFSSTSESPGIATLDHMTISQNRAQVVGAGLFCNVGPGTITRRC